MVHVEVIAKVLAEFKVLQLKFCPIFEAAQIPHGWDCFGLLSTLLPLPATEVHSESP